MRVDEQVGVDRDHRCSRSHSCIIARSDTSTPGGSPPSTVTQRIVRALPSVRLAVRPSSARKPRSIRTRSGCRSSAARCLAAMKRSSGRSTVVFIWENNFPSLLPVKWRRSFKNLPDRVSLGRQPAHRRRPWRTRNRPADCPKPEQAAVARLLANNDPFASLIKREGIVVSR